MNRVEIVAIAVRLLALWMMFTAASLTAITVVSILEMGGGTPDAAIPSVTVSLALLVFGFMTWKLSVWLASGLLPRPTSNETVVSWGARDAESAAFRVLGVYLIATAIGGGAQAIIGLSGGHWLAQNLRLLHTAELARSSVLILFGLALFLGRSGLLELRDRVAGGSMQAMPPEDEETEAEEESTETDR